MSVWALANNGTCVTFNSDRACIEWPDGCISGYANPRTRHWEVMPDKSAALTTTIDNKIADLPDRFDPEMDPKPRKFSNNFIHEQCGHPGQDKTWTIEKIYKIKIRPCECQDCIASKSTKAIMK